MSDAFKINEQSPVAAFISEEIGQPLSVDTSSVWPFTHIKENLGNQKTVVRAVVQFSLERTLHAREGARLRQSPELRLFRSIRAN